MRTEEAMTFAPSSEPSEATTAPRAWWQRIDYAVLALAAITIVAFLVRIYDINWDQNGHLHPDERQITLVSQCLGLHSVPPGCKFVPDPANPHFFAYGSFPMYLLALVANGLAHLFAGNHGLPTDSGTFNDYNHFTLVGRALSAIFDTGTVLVTGLLARRFFGRWWGVVAATILAFSVIDIQLSHFYAVDTVLTFFTTLALLGALGLSLYKPSARAQTAITNHALPPIPETLAWALLTGLAFGLAMSSKISAAPLALPIGLALLLRWRRLGLGGWPDIVLASLTTMTVAFLTFVATMPYAFLDAAEFWRDVNEQSSLAKGTIVYPYTIQFANRTPYLDQIKNLFIWDLGALFMLAAGAGIIVALVRLWRRWDDALIIPLSWVIVYFGITGSFYTKFPRYQLPIVPALALLATGAFAALWGWRAGVATEAGERFSWRRPLDNAIGQLNARFGPSWPRRLAQGLAALTIVGGLFWTLAYMHIYTQPMTRLAASDWIYAHIPAGSTLTYEIWDDALPLARGTNSSYNYKLVGLGLYDADSAQKADVLANQLAGVDDIILASNRLYGSITRVPAMYPMTSRYYQLLFNGSLGFHLIQTFADHPQFGPVNLPDTTADESFSVYDHPTVWIFQRDAAYPLTADAIKAALLNGVSLPTASSALASQKPLLLSQKDIAADNQNAPLWQRFNPAGWQTTFALPLWWLAIEILGLCAFPIAFIGLPGLRDRGWGLAKALGVLGLSFLIWLPASLGIVPYMELTVWLAALALAAIGGAIAWRRRDELATFFREHWSIIVLTELITLAAFLFFVGVRSLDPDLWHIWRGGEKPMELTFLNGILRSQTLPPLDPWFAGSYINYYYFGQFLIATLIELTGIVPTTAFNLAIPMLFALTISGAISVVGGIARRWWVGAVAGWAVAVASNLDGMVQWWQQFQAMQMHLAPIAFNYWQSSRVIPFTINEFPLWSFVYADLHAHVIDLPIVLLGLGVAASLLGMGPGTPRWQRNVGLGIAALALGAMACINTWDMPTYGAVIIVALLAAEWRALPRRAGPAPDPSTPLPTPWDYVRLGWYSLRAIIAGTPSTPDAAMMARFANQSARRPRPVITWSDIRNVSLSILAVVGGAIALYLPFYAHFQSLYGQIGPVTTPTSPILFFTLFGLWLFLIVSFFAVEILDRWNAYTARLQREGRRVLVPDPAQRALLVCGGITLLMTFLTVRGVKALLLGLIVIGVLLALTHIHPPARQFAYLVILAGLGVALVVEIVYLRDFLDGGDWRRMNTVFKFYYQVWMLFALGGALSLGMILPRFLASARDLLARARLGMLSALGRPREAEGPQLPLAFAATTAPGDTGPIPQVSLPDSEDEHASADATLKDEIPTPEWVIPVAPEPSLAIPAQAGDAFVAWGLRLAWLVVLVGLLFGSTVFLYEGTAARISDRAQWIQAQPPPGPVPATPSLDGFAYMHAWYPGDADAITWMNEHIAGAPVILEASADPYQWFGRVSIYTGLPSVLGWANHESQQRYPDEVFQRSPDVTAVYTSNDPATVMSVVNRYHVRYIYVGQLECIYYAQHDPNPSSPALGNVQLCNAAHSFLGPLQVFPRMADQGQLRVAYQNSQVTLYEVVET